MSDTPRETWLENQYDICMRIMPPVDTKDAVAVYDMLSHDLDDNMKQTVPDSAGAARAGRTGYSEAGIVDRLNRVLGPSGWMSVYRVRKEANMPNPKGTGVMYFTVVDLLIWVPSLRRFADSVGYGKGMDPGDSEKSATTTAMKRAARMIGPGWQAYAGLVDGDLSKD